MSVQGPRGLCPGCHRSIALRGDGRIRGHGTDGTTCAGSGQTPAKNGDDQ